MNGIVKKIEGKEATVSLTTQNSYGAKNSYGAIVKVDKNILSKSKKQ